MELHDIRIEDLPSDSEAGWRVSDLAVHPQLPIAYLARYKGADRLRRNLVATWLEVPGVSFRFRDHEVPLLSSNARSEEAGATAVAVHPDGEHLYVATSADPLPAGLGPFVDPALGFTNERLSALSSHQVSCIELQSGMPVEPSLASYDVGGVANDQYVALEVHPGCGCLFLAGSQLRRVALDDASARPTDKGSVILAGNCRGFAFSSDGRFVYVSTEDAIVQVELDPVEGTPVGTPNVSWQLPGEPPLSWNRTVIVTDAHVYAAWPARLASEASAYGAFGVLHGLTPYSGGVPFAAEATPLLRTARPTTGWSAAAPPASEGTFAEVLAVCGDRTHHACHRWSQPSESWFTVVEPRYRDDADGRHVLVGTNLTTIIESGGSTSTPLDRVPTHMAVGPDPTGATGGRVVVVTEHLPAAPKPFGAVQVRVYAQTARTSAGPLDTVELQVTGFEKKTVSVQNSTAPKVGVADYLEVDATALFASTDRDTIDERRPIEVFVVDAGPASLVWTVEAQLVAGGAVLARDQLVIAGNQFVALVPPFSHPAWQPTTWPNNELITNTFDDAVRLKTLAEATDSVKETPRSTVVLSATGNYGVTPVGYVDLGVNDAWLGLFAYWFTLSALRALGFDSTPLPTVWSWRRLGPSAATALHDGFRTTDANINALARYFADGNPDWTAGFEGVIEQIVDKGATRSHLDLAPLAFIGGDDFALAYPPNGWETEFAGQDVTGAFRTFLKGRGFVPADLNAATWDDVAFAWPRVDHATADLLTRRCVYWSSQYARDQGDRAMERHGQELRSTFGTQIAPDALWGGVANETSGARQHPLGKGEDPKYGVYLDLLPDWFRAARSRSHNPLVYLARGEGELLNVPYRADLLRSAASNTDPSFTGTPSAGMVDDRLAFSGYVDPKLFGTWRGDHLLTALALVGRGCRFVPFYMWGPAYMFKDGWVGGRDDGQAMKRVKECTALISAADETLGRVQTRTAEVAMLTVDGSGLWDHELRLTNRRVITDEHRATYWTLRLAGYQVDFVSDDDVALGALTRRSYAVLYVTSPSVSQAAQLAISQYVGAGGSLVCGPRGGIVDEANEPAIGLDALLGVSRSGLAAPTPRALHGLAGNGPSLVVGPTATLTPALTVDVIATTTAPDGGDVEPAVTRYQASAAAGHAWAFSFYQGLEHEHGVAIAGGGINRWYPDAYDETVRDLVVEPARQVCRPLEIVATPFGIETFVMDSDTDVAITITNWTNQRELTVELTVPWSGADYDVRLASGRPISGWEPGPPMKYWVFISEADVLLARKRATS